MNEKAIHWFWATVEAEVRRAKCYHAGLRGLWHVPEFDHYFPGRCLLKEGVCLFEEEEDALRAAIQQGQVKREVLAERILSAANRLVQIVQAKKENRGQP